MRSLQPLSVFCTTATLFVTTTTLAFAAPDTLARSALEGAGGASGFRNICAANSCVPTIISAFINIALSLIGVALIGYVLYAGFLWMTAGGEDEQIKSARTMIRNAVIGVVIIGSSYTLATMVVRLVGETFTSSPPTPPAGVQTSAPPPGTVAPTPPVPIPRETAPDPFANGCTQTACQQLCIQEDDCVHRVGTREFTCEASCHDRCQRQCGFDGAPVEPTPSGGCRDAAGFRTCREACRTYADTSRRAQDGPALRDAPGRADALQAITEEEATCNTRCTTDHCSP